MSRVTLKKQKMFSQIWSKYQDTLWKIEKAWNNQDLDYNKRSVLTNSVLEMLKIEKKLKSIEHKYHE